MKPSGQSQQRAVALLLKAGLVISACSDPAGNSHSVEAKFAKAGASPSVKGAIPSYGHQGDVGLAVLISGSGFDQGSVASWERNGVPDPSITVHATRFISSSQVEATISIEGDADLALYDIAITTGRGRKGIGTEMFEVTTANALPALSGTGSNSYAWGLNDAGAIVGRSNGLAFFWTVSGGMENLGPGQAFDLDQATQVVVGVNEVPFQWTGGTGNWSGQPLPRTCVSNVIGGNAFAISRDGVWAGGNFRVGVSKGKANSRAILWNLVSGGCMALPLPAGFADHTHVNDVNSLGMAVGLARSDNGANRAVLWQTDHSALLLPGEGNGLGITEDGTIVVGLSGGGPAYWLFTAGGWSNPIALGGSCNNQGWAADINDVGLIVGKACDGRGWYWQLQTGVVVQAGQLPGLGPQGYAIPEAVSSSTGSEIWIVGGSSDQAVYWNRF